MLALSPWGVAPSPISKRKRTEGANSIDVALSLAHRNAHLF